MSKIPAFYCMRTLLGTDEKPDPNRVTLYGPDGTDFKFVLLEMGEVRSGKANARCNELAAALTKLWEDQNLRR